MAGIVILLLELSGVIVFAIAMAYLGVAHLGLIALVAWIIGRLGTWLAGKWLDHLDDQ